MLTILGNAIGRDRFCDRHIRRDFLKIGGLALGGLSLPQILKAESAGQIGGAKSSGHKGIIMIYLPGGPPHQDMWDIKPDAPLELRGEFNAISTSVPGIGICELFPRIAASMEKFVPIRSIVGADGAHYAYQCLTGWRLLDRQPQGGWPSLGSVLSKTYGPIDASVPAFVGLSPPMRHRPWADNGTAGFLGVAHAPFTPNADGKDDLVLNGLTLDRLSDRRALLVSLDRFRRQADAPGQMEGADAFTEQAFGVLTSKKLADALNIEKESPALREKYGRGFDELRDDGGPRLIENLLIARRLISAGARCVTLAFSTWDWHVRNFQQAREDMPLLDRGVATLVEDLEQRGMLDDVSVVVWGEFGRTPKINGGGGRDHWPQVSCALLAGGGMRTGQVIGATNRLGEYVTKRPVHFQEVFATLYRNLGIDVNRLPLRDLQGRPQYLVDHNVHQPLPELA